MTLSSHSVTTASANRLARNAPIVDLLALASLAREPSLADVDVAHPGHLEAAHVLLRRAEVEVEVREDDGSLVEQQLLDLSCHSPLRLDVEGRCILGHELVVLRVLE